MFACSVDPRFYQVTTLLDISVFFLQLFTTYDTV